MGELLKAIPKAGNGKLDSHRSEIPKSKMQTVKESGITQRQAEHFQYMALAVEKQVAVEAKENQIASGEHYGKGAKVSSNLNEPIRTASKAAESIGVSENTYRDMKLVAEKGSDEQIERMNKGG